MKRLAHLAFSNELLRMYARRNAHVIVGPKGLRGARSSTCRSFRRTTISPRGQGGI